MPTRRTLHKWADELARHRAMHQPNPNESNEGHVHGAGFGYPGQNMADVLREVAETLPVLRQMVTETAQTMAVVRHILEGLSHGGKLDVSVGALPPRFEVTLKGCG